MMDRDAAWLCVKGVVKRLERVDQNPEAAQELREAVDVLRRTDVARATKALTQEVRELRRVREVYSQLCFDLGSLPTYFTAGYERYVMLRDLDNLMARDPMPIELRAAYRYECSADPQHVSFMVTAQGAQVVDQRVPQCSTCGQPLRKIPLQPEVEQQ